MDLALEPPGPADERRALGLPRVASKAYFQMGDHLGASGESATRPPPRDLHRLVRHRPRNSGDWLYRKGGSASPRRRLCLLGSQGVDVGDQGSNATSTSLRPGPSTTSRFCCIAGAHPLMRRVAGSLAPVLAACL